MKKTVIKFTNVSKQYLIQEDRTIKDLILSITRGQATLKQHFSLSKVSFEIKEGETVALIGKNGAGKSTVLKLIAGVTYPSKGRVTVKQKVAPLIELGAGFHHELTGLENIYLNAAILGMHKPEIEQKVNQIIEFTELNKFIKIPVKRYSTGMFMRLAFAIAVHAKAPILLIDEVLAVGDKEFQDKCLDHLEQIKKDKKRTIFFVSHDENLIKKFCERALLLREGKLIIDDTPEKVFKIYNQFI
ncbi:MAG: ABC transporter ATP-binding protein [Candidatus Woesebacteria bacterium]|jgi:ABC-type polysaccharide/polyol phosphate transport system ATPase subunit